VAVSDDVRWRRRSAARRTGGGARGRRGRVAGAGGNDGRRFGQPAGVPEVFLARKKTKSRLMEPTGEDASLYTPPPL
jgi:hypothetical protein